MLGDLIDIAAILIHALPWFIICAGMIAVASIAECGLFAALARLLAG